MATYSAFFSSGLLAPSIARCTTPVSPMAIATSPVDPVDRRLTVTPTHTNPCAKAPEAHTNAERPRMRRRRSSINIATSPMALIKSPVRNAGAALQRTGITSPTRHRATSAGMSGASEDSSLFGRLRNGGVGGPIKRLRRAIRAPIPLVSPPSVPLPALPSSPTAKHGSLLPPAILRPVPRQSFPTSSCIENVYPPRPFTLDSKIPILSHGLFTSCGDTIEEATMEN